MLTQVHGAIAKQSSYSDQSFWRKKNSGKEVHYRTYDEKILPTRDIIEQGDPYLKEYFRIRGKEGSSVEEKVEEFEK